MSSVSRTSAERSHHKLISLMAARLNPAAFLVLQVLKILNKPSVTPEDLSKLRAEARSSSDRSDFLVRVSGQRGGGVACNAQ